MVQGTLKLGQPSQICPESRQGCQAFIAHMEQLLGKGYPWGGVVNVSEAAHFGQGLPWRGFM